MSVMPVHTCGVCWMDSGLHPEDCYEPEHIRHMQHWPPLCCPGCPCLSFEEAHPGFWDSPSGIALKKITAKEVVDSGREPLRG